MFERLSDLDLGEHTPAPLILDSSRTLEVT